MKPPSWAVRDDDTLWRAERIMARRRTRQLPVLRSGKLVGMLSERDLLDFRASQPEGWWLAPVARAMHDAPRAVGPDEPATEAADRLAASPDGILPIVEGDFLVGVVTATDLLDADLRASRAALPATVADVMTDSLVTVRPTDSLVEAAALMVDNQIRHLPVMENGALVGMLSDRDIRNLAGDPVRFIEARGDDAHDLSVRDAMTRTVTTISPDGSIAELAETLADENIGGVPVVDRDGRLVGIVSYVDVLGALAA